jgi:hypothetical protein
MDGMIDSREPWLNDPLWDIIEQAEVEAEYMDYLAKVDAFDNWTAAMEDSYVDEQSPSAS